MNRVCRLCKAFYHEDDPQEIACRGCRTCQDREGFTYHYRQIAPNRYGWVAAIKPSKQNVLDRFL